MQLASGEPVPPLTPLATHPRDLDWIEGLPFRYDTLDPDGVIKVILQISWWRWWRFFKRTATFRARLAQEGGMISVTFLLTVNRDDAGKLRLEIASTTVFD